MWPPRRGGRSRPQSLARILGRWPPNKNSSTLLYVAAAIGHGRKWRPSGGDGIQVVEMTVTADSWKPSGPSVHCCHSTDPRPCPPPI